MTTRLAAATLLVTLGAACGGDPTPFSGSIAPPRAATGTTTWVPDQTFERQVIFQAAMEVTVEDPAAAATQVESLVASASGYIERSRGGGDDKVEMNLRVPSASLDQVMAGIRPLGEVKRETRNSSDVTGRIVDLEARIQSLSALRERLRSYVERATTVSEVIALEAELTRVQTEIERLTGELTRLRGEVAMSELGVTLDKKHTRGPLTAAGYGVAWFFEKLFVWN